MADPTLSGPGSPDLPVLLSAIRELIRSARQSALRAVATIHVQACPELGRHIVEFEQAGAAVRLTERLLATLSGALTMQAGNSADQRKLWHMRRSITHFRIGTQCVPN